MIKTIALVVIIGLLIAALSVPIGAFLGVVDFTIFTDAIEFGADIVEPFILTFDLLTTTFPYMLVFILYFSFLGIIRLVVKQFEKE
jgi:uncharacterized membrane protein